jgi:hypothetical protein
MREPCRGWMPDGPPRRQLCIFESVAGRLRCLLEPDGVDFGKLDPVFAEFRNGRASQKAKFKGEFFPSTLIAADIGRVFVEFFQVDRFTGNRKGILSISIDTDEVVVRRAKL